MDERAVDLAEDVITGVLVVAACSVIITVAVVWNAISLASAAVQAVKSRGWA